MPTLDEAVLIALHAHKTGHSAALSLTALTRALELLLKHAGTPVSRRQVEQALARAEGAQRIRLVSPGGKGPRGARVWDLLVPCPNAYDVPGYAWTFLESEMVCNGICVGPVHVLLRAMRADVDGVSLWLRAVGALEWAQKAGGELV